LLGLHPIFKTLNKLNDLRQLNVIQLIKKQQSIEHNIWRIKSELCKGDKPHLNKTRNERLQEKNIELNEINRLIQTFSK
jgi:hypothetical protein